jgi:prepilin-type N-terminal cleavage/methylation domain-containing protein
MTARWRRAFSLVEVMTVVIVLGILAAIVVPNFAGATDDAKASAVEGSLGAVRSAISGYRSKNLLSGGSGYPTLAQLTTAGTVVEGDFPQNPFSKLKTVQAVSQAQAQARAVVNAGTYGWNYYVDNTASPPAAVFYANSSDVTTVTDASGDPVAANEL